MVCMRNATTRTETITETDSDATGQEKTRDATTMDLDATIDVDLTANEPGKQQKGDRLQLQHFAGSEVISNPPLFSDNGEYLLIINRQNVNVYATLTGELSRTLHVTEDSLVSMHFELREPDVLVACTVSGDVLRWNWPTGELLKKLPLQNVDGEVMTFNLINFYGRSNIAYGFLTVHKKRKEHVWAVYDLSSGLQAKVPLKMAMAPKKPLVSVSQQFNYLALATAGSVSFIDYKGWRPAHFKNAHKKRVTALSAHPTELLFATGDEDGRIFLWREFVNKDQMKNSLYHWHHTAVTSIVFSAIGSSFYSAGLESVLVKWNIHNPEIRNYMARMPSVIKQIGVSPDNSQVAVCTADNAVQIVGGENKIKCTLQEFTYIIDDKTGRPKYPIGLRFNPRTNTMVLNGRSGHIQFYSVQTKTLLFNMDVVQQNPLSTERDKILYNIAVTKAAFNIDWIVTGEEYNDEEHLPELRLKFWQFDQKSQGYVLNTNVELPHEGGFRAIEFSSEYQVDSLLCATLGHDNTIKMWALEETDDIYKKGKVVWYCIGQTSYKSLPIESICFSQDGSLLAAGCGNTLCLYKASNLKLKAALTGGAGLDGSVQKAQVRLAKTVVAPAKKAEYIEQRKKLLQSFAACLENNDDATFFKQLQSLAGSAADKPIVAKRPQELDAKQREYLYHKILQMHELNLFQKLLLYQKLGIKLKVQPSWEKRMLGYLNQTVNKESRYKRASGLLSQVHRLGVRQRFKAKHRVDEFVRRKHAIDVAQKDLVPLMNLLDLNKNTKTPPVVNGKQAGEKDGEEKVLPLPKTAEGRARITKVQFAAGEYAHLVVVCSESRVMVWNLLTLRLQMVFKLSVQHLAFDATANLFAAITTHNELHVFQPHIAFPLYQRANLPQMYAAIWLPRRYPKSCSLNLDWQAQSILYFLNDNQEIVYLKGPEEDISDSSPAITFTNAAKDKVRYSMFGAYAQQQHSDKKNDEAARLASGPLVLGREGKNAVKSLVEMSSHTMPPLNLFCTDFIKALVKPADSSKLTNRQNATGGPLTNGTNGYATNGNDEDDSNESDGEEKDDAVQPMDVDQEDKFKLRHGLLQKAQESVKPKLEKAADAVTQGKQLQRVAAQNIELEF